MKNTIIRNTIKERGLKLWQVADELGMSDANFSRLLRHELDETKKGEVLRAVERAAARKECDDE